MQTLLRASLFILLVVACAFGRGRASGYCQQGGQTIQVLGYQSSATTPVQASYTGSSCNVLVLYSNGGGTTATGPSGIVSTSGTSVTWLSGNVFNANGQWSGLTITIAATPYTISSCSSAASCTLGSSAGTQTSAAYSMSAATPAAIFGDNAGTPKSNPFSVSATGYWFYYADNGSYANQYSGTAIQTTFTNAALPLSDPSNLPNVIRWNPTLGTTFAQQCAAVVSAPNTTLVVDTTAPVATGFTAACSLLFYTGGIVQPASGQIVTITGAVTAPPVKIFDTSLAGAGSIVLSAPNIVVPVQWFGGVADYDGTTGTDNSVPMTAALAAVCAHPATVKFPGGGTNQYGVAAGTTMTSCTGTAITGDPGVNIIYIQGTTDTQYGSWPNYGKDSILRLIDCTAITIETLILDANLQNRTAHAGSESSNSDVLVAGSSNINLDNVILQNGMTDGFTAIYDASNVPNTGVWLTHSQLRNNRRNNISLDGCIHCFVTDNYIAGAGSSQGTAPEAGIDVEPDIGTTGQISQDITIENNGITTSGGTYALFVGTRGTAGCTVANNRIFGNTGTGADFESTTGYQNTDCVFTGNSVYGNGGAGIRAVGRNVDLISGNKLRNNTTFGVQIYSSNGLIIDGNVLESNGNGGITGNIGAGLTYVDLSIKNNTFLDNCSMAGGSTCYVLSATAAAATSTLNFTGNTTRGSVGAGFLQEGVALTGACNCYGVGNLVQNISGPFNINSTPGIESIVNPPVVVLSNNGSAIASATVLSSDGTTSGTSIVGPLNYISGTTPIANIVPPANCNADTTPACGIVVIASSAGLVAVTGGTAGKGPFEIGLNFPAKQPVLLTYDSSFGYWHGSAGCSYISSETGGNAAIAGTCVGAPLTAGLVVQVLLGHTLTGGAENTFAYNGGGALDIRSHRNSANNIATGYASGGIVTLSYNGTFWLDMSQ